MNINEFRRCAVVGIGAVGAAISYALMRSALFSEIVLIDSKEEKSQGEAMDLSHGSVFFPPQRIFSGSFSDLAGASVVIIAAGANQEPGENRPALFERNAKILDSILNEVQVYAPGALLLIVTNPVDLLTHRAVKKLGYDITGTPGKAARVIGSGTVLDTARLKFALGQYFRLDFRNIHAFVIGEHGDSEVAVWSSANISGIDLDAFDNMRCPACGEHSREALRKIFDDVKNSAYQIIHKKGATSYGIASSVLRILEAVVRDEKSILTVSAYTQGEYGIVDAAIGLPAVIGKNGVEQILEIPLDADERTALMQSVNTLYPGRPIFL